MANGVHNWLDASEYNIESGWSLYKAKRYLSVPEACYLAVEKMLIAVCLRETGKLPPRTDNLLELVEISKVEFDREQLKFIKTLYGYYIDTSLEPKDFDTLAKELDNRKVYSCLKDTEELLEWLSGDERE